MTTENTFNHDTIDNPFEQPSPDTPPLLQATPNFYVVSKKKFVILFYTSLGLYPLYWFWHNWTLWKKFHNSDIWPLPRSLFFIFFTHSMFKKIHATAEQVTTSKLPKLQIAATIFVVSQIVMSFIDELIPDDPITPGAIGIAINLGISTWALWQAQKLANIASYDDNGSQNDKFTIPNYIVVVLGGGLWVIILLGVLGEMLGVF